MIKVFDTAEKWRRFRESGIQREATVGFVPTMGALHAGHMSLVERSLRENDFTIVSIFVNPAQFNNPKDLEKYPRPLDSDIAMLERQGAHFALCPSTEEIYSDSYRYRIHESEISAPMEGIVRPGHFDGMLTVVLKLLNIVGADRAYFGEKDRQQLELVKGMADAFFLRTKIIGCPTVRDPRGLALSSRNALLTTQNMEIAPLFHKILSSEPNVAEARLKLQANGFEVEYIEKHGSFRYGAVKLGDVRLIDNVDLPEELS